MPPEFQRNGRQVRSRGRSRPPAWGARGSQSQSAALDDNDKDNTVDSGEIKEAQDEAQEELADLMDSGGSSLKGKKCRTAAAKATLASKKAKQEGEWLVWPAQPSSSKGWL